MRTINSFVDVHLRLGGWILAACVFRVSLDVSYYFYVSWDFSGDGFLWNPSHIRYLESIGALLLSALIVPRCSMRTTDFLVLVFFVLCVVPITSYYALMGGDRIWFWILVSQFFVFRYSILLLPDRKIGVYRCPSLSFSISPALGCSLAIILAVALHVAINGKPHLFSFSLQKVYQHREIASAVLEQGIWGYLVNWASKVCAIYVTIDGFRRKNWALVFLGVGCAFALYGVFAHKSTILALAAAGAVWFVWPVIRLCSAILVYSVAALLAIFFIIAPLLEINWLQSVLVRRLFFIPARLNFIYFDFFSNFDPLYFSNGILRSFFQYPFDKPYPLLVGEYSGIGGAGTYANGGFIATGFMQLGWFGVVIYPMLAALVSKVVDWIAVSEDCRFFVAVCFFPFAVMFTSSDLPTSLMTHGIGLVVLLLLVDGFRERSNKQQSGFASHRVHEDSNRADL